MNTNNSTSVEHNSKKTLAQNKFNTRPKFYFLSKQHFLLYAPLSSYLSSVSLRFSERIYRQTPRDGELTRINQIILQLSRAVFLKLCAAAHYCAGRDF